MNQTYFASTVKPEDGSRLTEEFRKLFQWQNANPNVILSSAQTTDATVTDITSVYLNEGDVYLVETYVLAKETDETNRALYHLEGLFYRNTSGDVTQEGSTTSITAIESDATWALTLNADTSSQAVDIRATGKAATVINWKAITRYTKVT